jgi:hypothetical protein
MRLCLVVYAIPFIATTPKKKSSYPEHSLKRGNGHLALSCSALGFGAVGMVESGSDWAPIDLPPFQKPLEMPLTRNAAQFERGKTSYSVIRPTESDSGAVTIRSCGRLGCGLNHDLV